MDRLREAGGAVLLTVGAIIGGAIGGYLGVVTERGSFGIIALLALGAGVVAGLYVAQAIAGARDEDDAAE